VQYRCVGAIAADASRDRQDKFVFTLAATSMSGIEGTHPAI
jgi:hypothetical protein